MEFIGAILLIAGAGALMGSLRGRRSKVSLINATVDAFRLGDGEEGELLFEALRPMLTSARDKLDVAGRLMAARAYEHSLELVEGAGAHNPDDARVLRARALLYAKLVRPEAIVLLREHLTSRPGDREVRFELAALLLRLRRTDEVVSVMEPYLNKNPDDLEANSLAGRAHFYGGDFDMATFHLEEALSIRDLRRRQVVSMYDNGLETGYDFRFAVEGRWEEEQDRLLLEQIREGEASARLATMAEPVI